jgi:RNA polymerase sigma-70 factor (ECF subfamily)
MDTRLTEQQDATIFAGLYLDLCRFAAVVGPLEMEPEDLVQEAVVRTLRLHELRSLDNPGAYLRQVIVRTASNARRSLGRRRAALARLAGGFEAASHPTYPSDVAELMRLDPRDRAALFLRDVEGSSYDEIAASLEVTESAARTIVSRARRRLRAELEEDRSE